MTDFALRRRLEAWPDRGDDLALAAIRAASAAATAAAEARTLAWLGPSVDADNPFRDVQLADDYLLGVLDGHVDVAFLATAADQAGHVGDDAINADKMAFDAMAAAARLAMPTCETLGEEDGHDPATRGERLQRAISTRHPWLLGDPIDGTLAYRRISTTDFWCSVAIVGHGPMFATAIVTGETAVVASNFIGGRAAQWTADDWRIIAPPFDVNEGADGFSAILPALKLKDRRHFHATLADDRVNLLCGFSGNPAVIRGVLQGLVSAAIQPACYAWDAAAAYVAATAKLPVLRMDADLLLDAPALSQLMIDRTSRGEKLPDLMIGRDQAAIDRFLEILPPRVMSAPE